MVLPQSMRLKGNKCFDHLLRSGRRYYGQSMTLRVVISRPQLLKREYRELNQSSCRCAVAISSKVSKKSVTRNKLRRIIHDHLKARLCNSREHSNKWALFSLKPSSNNQQITPLLEECDNLLRNAGLLK